MRTFSLWSDTGVWTSTPCRCATCSLISLLLCIFPRKRVQIKSTRESVVQSVAMATGLLAVWMSWDPPGVSVLMDQLWVCGSLKVLQSDNGQQQTIRWRLGRTPPLTAGDRTGRPAGRQIHHLGDETKLIPHSAHSLIER